MSPFYWIAHRSGVSVLASRLKHTAGALVHPVRLGARDTPNRPIRLGIIGDRWIIGPALHLLAGVGAAVEESGHEVL
jgi:hypothetical protein